MHLEKQQVHDFWNDASCGENLYLASADRAGYEAQSKARYELEPYIFDFARFDEARGKCVLEIGVGLGSDHQKYAEAGADLYGIDLTEKAVQHTLHRFEIFGLTSHLVIGDAENLGFPDEFFDIVYSWGVLHHSPNTSKAVEEVFRVLKPGGVAKVMIYHKWSLVGFMLWIRYALLCLRPWLPLKKIYAQYLESPGTKAFTVAEAKSFFSRFREVSIRIQLGHGDLLESQAGQRHNGLLLSLARKIWPRFIIKRFFPTLGLGMLIEARK